MISIIKAIISFFRALVRSYPLPPATAPVTKFASAPRRASTSVRDPRTVAILSRLYEPTLNSRPKAIGMAFGYCNQVFDKRTL